MIGNKRHPTRHVYKWESDTDTLLTRRKRKRGNFGGMPPALGAAILLVILALRVGRKSRVESGFQTAANMFDSGQTGFESQSSSLLGLGTWANLFHKLRVVTSTSLDCWVNSGNDKHGKLLGSWQFANAL